MDSSKRFAFNSICTAVMQLSALLCGFITNHFILEAYSAEMSGFAMSIIQFSSYAVMTVAGITGAALYALYAPLAIGDYTGANNILTQANRYYKYISYVMLAVSLVAAIIYPLFAKADLSSGIMSAFIFVMSLCTFLEMAVISRCNALLSADQRTYVISLASAMSYILQTVLMFIFTYAGASAIFVCISYFLATALRAVIISLYVKRSYREINYKGKPQKAWSKLQADVLYMQIMFLLQTVLPLAFTTVFTNLETVRVYSTYNIVITGLQAILTIFTTNILPAFGNIIAQDEQQALVKAYRGFELGFFAFATLVCSAATMLITDFVRIYTAGIENSGFESAEIGFLFIMNILFLSLQIPQNALIQAKGMYKESKMPATVQIIILCLLSAVLAPIYGMSGILVASICGNIYRSIRLVFFVPKIAADCHCKRSFFRQGVTVLILIISYCLYGFFSPHISSYAGLFVYAVVIVIAVSAFITAIMLIFERKDFIEIILSVKRILHR